MQKRERDHTLETECVSSFKSDAEPGETAEWRRAADKTYC
jgi:hypothetical protein